MVTFNRNGNLTIAIDGHDGSGKTTIAEIVATQLNAEYVRPFGGSAGHELIAAFEKKDYRMVMQVGQSSIQKVYDRYENKTLVFDRHWMTVLSLVPEIYWKEWSFFPDSFLCWADLETTLKRLDPRTEEKFNAEYHSGYLLLYKKLAEMRNVIILNTSYSDVNECVEIILRNFLT